MYIQVQLYRPLAYITFSSPSAVRSSTVTVVALLFSAGLNPTYDITYSTVWSFAAEKNISQKERESAVVLQGSKYCTLQ